MDQQKSQFLHGLRWLSSLFVVIGHSQLIGGGGDRVFAFLAAHAHAAVMVFFVLSGYVIAATVAKKRSRGYSLQAYLIDRVSRIYSVLLPAILFTVLLDFAGARLFPERYADPALLPQTDRLVRFLLNALCLQGLWGYPVQLGSNPPLWSIGYEFCYYLVFGLVTWRPRWWGLLLAAVLLTYGPEVALYGSLWWLGVLAWRLNRRGVTLPFLPALAAFLLANQFLEYRPAFPWPEAARDVLFGLAVAMLAMTRPALDRRLFAFNEFMADFSYSTYAYHMPVMFLVYSFVAPTPLTSWAMVVVALAVARLLYQLTESRRAALKTVLTDTAARLGYPSVRS